MPDMTTIPRLFWQRVDDSSDEIAFHRHVGEGHWDAVSWQEIAGQVVSVAEVLREAGVGSRDRVAFYSENRDEWPIVDLAIQLVPAVHVPLHAPLTAAQARYQIDHCQAKAVIVSGNELATRLEQAYERLPTATRWFSLDSIDRPPFRPLPSLAASVDRPGAEDAARRVAEQVTEEELATILYTSGTTGEPKGVMLSQRNLYTNATSTAAVYDQDPGGLRLGMLPLSHIFARVCDLYMWLARGNEFALARNRETVLEDCQVLKPHWLNGVPYFFDKCYRILREQGIAEQPDAVSRLLGGRIEYCCCGGAGLPEYLFDYYQSQGVPVLPGYGLTESSPVISVSRTDAVRRGASGRPIADVQVRIAEDGEILTKGPHVMMGYYRDPEATSQAIRDGWLYTGDYGRIDSDGFLYVTGRKKEIIVTAGGKNVSPILLESLLTQDPLIEQALVVGDSRKYLAALIVPNLRLLRRRFEQHSADDTNMALADADMLEDPRVEQWFEAIIQRQLASLSPYEQVRRFRLLERPFSIEAGEMTPKLSLRRKVIEERYRDVIDAMYESPKAD